MAEAKKLFRSDEGKLVGGVCAGIAKYTDTDVTVVRIAALVLALVSAVGPFLAVYLIAYLLMKPELKSGKK